MFAVIRTGGKQYCVKPGDVLKVEKLEAQQGSSIAFNDVLMVTDDSGKVTFGNPLVDGASINAEILKHSRNKKIVVFKKKRRHNYRRKIGHKQHVSVLKVKNIVVA
jgi:large subunit ribosomal protein L21